MIIDIVLTCEQQQKYILQPSDTSSTHAHEVHSYFHMIEEFEVKKDEDQAPIHFQTYYELPLRGCCTILEEVHDITSVEPI